MTSTGAEWRSGAEDTTNSARCGMPVNPLLKESSFGCSIRASGSSTYEMRKLKKYSDWQAMPYKEKTLYDDFKYIAARATIVGLPKIITDVAMRYYALLSENSTFRGLNRDGIVAASIYISCRVNGVPRTPKEISEIFGIDTTSATKGCKNAVAIIRELEQGDDSMNDMVFTAITPTTFIDRYSNRMGLGDELSRLCKFICVIVNKKGIIPGNTPHSIAAGVLYYVCEKFQTKITKSAISQSIDISEVTISKCHKQLCETDIPLIPEILLKKYKISM
jgi:transcription initiation factor TFIIB